MISTGGKEFVAKLSQSTDVIRLLVPILKTVAKTCLVKKPSQLISTELLELEADYLREKLMQNSSSSLIDKRMNIKVDGIYTHDNKIYLKVSRGCKEVYLFKIREDKGKKVG